MPPRKRMECKVDEEQVKQNQPSSAYCRIGFRDPKDNSFVETARKDMVINPNSGQVLNTLSITGESPKDIESLNQITGATFVQQLEKAKRN